MFLLAGCSRERAQGPEVARQRALWEPKGWAFVEVCGDSRWPTDSLEVRTQGSSPRLAVYANSSGIDGRDPKDNFEKAFAESGFTFMEVKVGTSPQDTYSIVFKKKVEPTTSPGAATS